MPIGNELDDFASSFSRTFGMLAGMKQDKRRLAEQTRQFDITNTREQERWETEKAELPSIRAAREAETGLRQEQTRGLAFENSPEQQALRTRTTEAAIDKIYGDIAYQGEQIPLLREQTKAAAFANTDEQRQLATNQLKATIDGLVAQGNLNQASADKIMLETELLPDQIRSEIAARDTLTRGEDIKNRSAEIDLAGKAARAAPILERMGVPSEVTGGFMPPARQAIPTESQPEPEGTSAADDIGGIINQEAGPGAGERGISLEVGPQSAIPTEEATIQQASLPAGDRSVLSSIVSQGATRPDSITGFKDAFADNLTAMIEAMPPEVRNGFTIKSGYRSPERQAELWQAALKKYGSPSAARKWVAPPGRSQHGHGNAADLGYGSNEARRWVHANAGKFGLDFPLGNEPWHIELAGARGQKTDTQHQHAADTPAPEGSTVSASGPQMLPTPRGGVLNRQEIATSGSNAAREGLKALYAGVTMQPTNQAPGAIPAQAQPQTDPMRDILSGNASRPDKQSFNNARTAVQQALPEEVSEAELNLAMLANAYDWAMQVDQDPEKAKYYAQQILQEYRGRHNQFMSFAQQLASTGRLDDAAKLAARAYAYVPDGKEAKFTKNKDGTFSVSTIDLATGEKTTEQIVPPNELFAKIMQWSPADFDRRIRAVAGAPSLAYEQNMGALAGPAPQVTYQSNVPQAIPTVSRADTGEMSTEEATRYDAALSARNTEIGKINEGLTPPKVTAREDTNTELAKLDEGTNIPPEVVEQIKTTFGSNFYSVASGMLQSNPAVIMEEVVADLQTTLNTAQAEQGLPFEVKNGDYLGTKKLRLGANEYNVPSNVAATIVNGVNRHLRAEVEARMTGAYEDYKTKLARNIAGAQTEQAFGRAIPDRNNNPNWRRDMSRGPIPTQ